MARYELNEIINNVYDPTVGALRTTGISSVRKVLIDKSVANTTYFGSAPQGLSEATTGWLLTKKVTAGTLVTFTHANDSWDNRVSATYT